jgi:putative transcriptional regulator
MVYSKTIDTENTYVITLLDILNKKEMSQRKLSELTGIRFATINDLCTNDSLQILFENVVRICEVLDVSPGDWIKIVPKADVESGKVKVHRKVKKK